MTKEEPRAPAPRPVDRLRWPALGLLYAVLAVAVTWPLAADLTAGIPLGTERVATVPLFNLWTLGWNVESLGRLYDGYWQAPIFHPAQHAFALSEPQPLTGLLAAALTPLCGSIVGAYNLILILALASNALLAAVCARVAGLSWLPAVAGGCLVLVLPFTHQELGVLQLVPLAGVLALAIGVLRFAEEPSLRRGLLLGASLALAYGLGSQIAIFGGLALLPAAVWLWWPHRRTRRAWAGLLAGGLLFGVLASPVLLAQARATSGERFERSLETVRKQSAQLEHYTLSAWKPLVPVPGVEQAERPSRRAFWPGAVRILLALAAVAAGLSNPSWRRLTVAGLLVLTAAFLLSLGANFRIGGLSLVEALRALPGLAQVRSFFRFALFVQLAVVGLATLGLELIGRRVRPRLAGRWTGPLLAAVALLAILEIRPAMGPIAPLPPLDLDLPWLTWVVEATEPGDVLAFVPFPDGRGARDYLGTSQWMYWQMRHWRPMVNGYSGFFPARFRELKKTMRTFPSAESLRALEEAGVRYCIVHRAFMEAGAERSTRGVVRLVPVASDPQHGLEVFSLQRAEDEPERARRLTGLGG